MKNILSAVSLFLAFITLAGCTAKPKDSKLPETSSETNFTAAKEETSNYVPAQKAKSDEELLKEAEEVTGIILQYGMSSEKIPQPNKEIYNNFFARIANYVVYRYMSAAASLAAKGQSDLYKQFIDVDLKSNTAIIARENMNKIVDRLFGLDALPATLISSPEFNKEKNQFEFKVNSEHSNGLDFTEMSAFYDEDKNIVVNFKLKDVQSKTHGFYRVIYSVAEENGERFIRFKVFYQL